MPLRAPVALALLAACTRSPGESAADSEPGEDTTDPARDTADTDSGTPPDSEACAPYGPPNRWWHACADDVPPAPPDAGFGPGMELPDLVVVDQHGDEVALRQFYGRMAIVDVSAVWCVPCQELAPVIDQLGVDLADDGVTVVTVLAEDVTGAPAQASDAAAWAAGFGVTGMVGSDPSGLLEADPSITGYPSTVLVDAGLRVIETDFERLDAELIARAAAGTPGSPEVCDNGIDDDVDFFADCQDPDCPATGACALASATEGAVEPCADAGVRGVDVWRVTVTGPSARVVVDTIDAEHTFEPMLQRAVAVDDRASTPTLIGDDERACTYQPVAWQCPDAFLGPGTWDVYVLAGYGADGGGSCADPAEGRYALQVYGEAEAEAIGSGTNAEIAVYGF